jgi:hypothetical protein
MADKPHWKRWGWRKSALPVVGALVLYVLSIGPIECLSYRGYLPQPISPAVRCVYLPLVALIDTNQKLSDARQWYIYQWVRMHDWASKRRTTWHDDQHAERAP